MDVNHVAKALRSQLVLGSSMVMIGNLLVDPGLFQVAKVNSDLFRVRDFTSDKNVLQLCSGETILKLIALTNEEHGSVCGTCFSLFLLRIFLNAVNSNDMSRSHCVYCIWPSYLFLTCCKGIHKTTLQNFANSAVSIIWLALRKDIRSLRSVTTEPLEHFFGQLRTWNREFSAAQLVIFTKKLELMIESCIRSNLCTGRSGIKGYQAGFEGFRNSIISMLEKRKEKQAKRKLW